MQFPRIALFLAALLCLSVVAEAKPRTTQDTLAIKRKQLQQIQLQKEQTRYKVKRLKRKENLAVDQLTVLQQRLETTSIQLEDSKFRLERAKKQLKLTKMAMGQAQRLFAREQDSAARRLRTIYKHRQTDDWEALLTAPDLVQFMTRYEYFKHISMSDAQLLNRLDQRMGEISHQQRRYGHAMQTISTVTENIEAQKEEIQSDAVDQSQLVAKIRNERADAEAALAQLERDSQQIEAMVRRLMAARRHMPRMGTGRFLRPVNSRIGDTFGMRYHPVLHIMRPHRGLDFPAPSGTPIVAADRGMVIFSGWFGSYGKVVIVDHGGDITTLYAHTSRLAVQKGQLVERGQTIAYVGTTGMSTGPHLHFEVHLNSAAVNPLGYIR